jgi:hypothetical protein
MNDKRLAEAFIRRNQLVVKPDSPAKIDGPRGLRYEHVGGAFDEIPVVLIGLQDAAESVAGLEERNANRGCDFGETMRGGKAGDTTTDDGD